MHLHILVLSDPEGAVRRLILYGRVPPAVIMQHMIGPCQVEANASCLKRENEEGRTFPS